ncbi:hypothetical protein BCV70DRAFT_30043 [Testicularia cyperi]|uniref:Uncharacterized protein n=1 Tax=Testicularia cyperi TaxID=1882483 RepID=A0A317XNB6_9BASI|nr:hypothetical protein BCV70DRAFT_30043 [Testicularia cyperi]
MTSIFTNWIGAGKLGNGPESGTAEVIDDVGNSSASASGSAPMSPIDRASSMTPKAPTQFEIQPTRFPSIAEHHQRETSDATLNGRISGHFNDVSIRDYGHRAFHSEHSRVPNSRPTSALYGSELGHERGATAASALGGVDSEAAWSGLQNESAKNSVQRKRRKVAPPELLVIVKPPPSKQTNPLNLQIQLVMPQSLQRREGSTRRASMESHGACASSHDTQPTPHTEMRRRDSIGSTRSAGSEHSMAGSVASTNSGKRVTPLYNLNFHNILSTTVSDAGTDQKVAKYIKKGIELDGFGILEPAELINGVNDLATQYRTGAAAAGPNISSVLASSHREVSSSEDVEDTSAFSAPANEQHGSVSAAAMDSNVEPPTSFQAMTPEARGVESNIGGKLLGKFKRFSIGARPSSSAGIAGETTSISTRNLASVSGTSPSLFGKLDSGRSNASGDTPQMTPGAGLAGGRRTEGYYWTVRKWNRRAQDGMGEVSRLAAATNMNVAGNNPVLSSVWKRFNLVNRMGGNEVHPPPSEIVVRFEWSRRTRKWTRRRKTEESQARMRASASLNASRSSIDQLGQMESNVGRASLGQRPQEPFPTTTSTSAQSLSVDPESRRSSYISNTRSPRRSVDTSAAGSSAPGHADDSGEESDPEDSETPWNCHLVLGPNTRIPLGTLSPAPHHPKLVGQLAVPFPLPDLSATGLGPDGAGLTREELKDIIIVTCLHLIVRESFGGLAKRKSLGGSDSGSAAHANSMANVSGWRLANIPKKP